MPGCSPAAATTGSSRPSRKPELGGRVVNWPRGRVLGGSGSINGLVFLRGSPHDYDRWAQAGARGWSLCGRAAGVPGGSRTWHRRAECLGPRHWRADHGQRAARAESLGAAAFIEACVAAGRHPAPHRHQRRPPSKGVAPIQMNVRRGRRMSTAQAYLRPARKRPQPARADRDDRDPVADRRTGTLITGCLARRRGRRAGGLRSWQRGDRGGLRRVDRHAQAADAVRHRRRRGACRRLASPVLLDRPGGRARTCRTTSIVRMVMFRTKPAGTLNERDGDKAAAWRRWRWATRCKRSGPMAVGATEATLVRPR